MKISRVVTFIILLAFLVGLHLQTGCLSSSPVSGPAAPPSSENTATTASPSGTGISTGANGSTEQENTGQTAAQPPAVYSSPGSVVCDSHGITAVVSLGNRAFMDPDSLCLDLLAQNVSGEYVPLSNVSLTTRGWWRNPINQELQPLRICSLPSLNSASISQSNLPPGLVLPPKASSSTSAGPAALTSSGLTKSIEAGLFLIPNVNNWDELSGSEKQTAWQTICRNLDFSQRNFALLGNYEGPEKAGDLNFLGRREAVVLNQTWIDIGPFILHPPR